MSTSTSPSTTISKPSLPTPTTNPRNYSILSIPITYLLAMPPHYYIYYHAMSTSTCTATNTLPRMHLENLRTHVSQATYNSLVRARGAHLNALEGFPLFAAAMLAGNYANLPASDLNWAAGTYIASRVVYTGLYIGTGKSEVLSYARSGVYSLGLGIVGWVLYKAGMKVRDGGKVEAKEL